MTWRERIVAARERRWWRLGMQRGFTADDRSDVARFRTCLVGEALETMGAYDWRYMSDETLASFSSQAVGLVYDDRVNDAERLLDQIEDRVLQLKREQVTP